MWIRVVVSRVATEADCMQSVFGPSMQCGYPRRENEKRRRQRGETGQRASAHSSACMRLCFLGVGQTSEVMCRESTRERHELLDNATRSTWQCAAILSRVKRKAWCMGRQRNATVVRPSGVPDHTGEQQGVGGSAWNPHMADSECDSACISWCRRV